MKDIIAWIESNPTTATLLGVILGALLTTLLPVMFRSVRRLMWRIHPPVKMRHRNQFAWFSLFENNGHTHIVILYSLEIINSGDRLVSVKDIRARYRLECGKLSPEILPATLPRPPSFDVGHGNAKVFPVFFTEFPALEAYGANITQTGDIAPSEIQSGFLLFIEDITEQGKPMIVDNTVSVEIRAYPEGMASVSCSGPCIHLKNDALENAVPGITQHQAAKSNFGSIDRFRTG